MLTAVRFWILLSTLLVGGGWILSALHQLNRIGYAILLLPVLMVIFLWCGKSRPLNPENFRRWRSKFSKRFRRRAPQFFLLIAALSFLGGCLYPAQNYDANAYRLPRVMHWLWAGQWHWIHTFDSRMNIAACGMEWLSAPLILFSHTDRLLFLINWISYLLLPGLIFSVFTRLQVRPRVAWWWTWLLSSGLCFALQAGSVANDSFAAIYILAAVDLALRSHEKNSVNDLWLSLLAAALAIGVKQTNIPLAALWLIAVWPALPLLWKNPWRTAVVAGFGLLVSIVPISLLNYQHYGTWLPLENNGIAAVGKFHLNPFWGVVGNAFCIPLQNLIPPFYDLLPPFYSYWPVLWNDEMRQFLQTSVGAHFASFENFGYLSVAAYHGYQEADAGIGMGLCIVIYAAHREIRRRQKSGGINAAEVDPVPFLWWLRIAPWGLLLVFVAKVGTYENARQLAPYYIFLFPAWLVKAGQSQITRQPSWRRLAVVVMMFTGFLVATSNERPLFPAQTIFKAVKSQFPYNEFLSDECVRYLESPCQVNDGRKINLHRMLPPDETVIGYYDKVRSVDETAIWLPFGQRRVECQLPDDPPERLRALGIHYVVVNGPAATETFGNIERWMNRYDASLVDQYGFPTQFRQKTAPADFYLVRLN